MALLELTDVAKSFGRNGAKVPVLNDIGLSIQAGEFVAITGPSGSGKSTLLNLMGCLDRFDRGTYRHSGTDVGSLTARERARLRNQSFGYVFQNYHLLPRATALQNVELPLRYRREPSRSRRQLAARLLTELGLEDRLHHRPFQLSGGEQQRVSIARAIIARPSVLFADEPTGALDSRTGSLVMEILKALNANGQTIVLVTHDPAIAQAGSRRVFMKDGRIVQNRLSDDLDESSAPAGSRGCRQ